MKEFSNEAKCWKYLANLRWPGGFVCPKCGCRHTCLLSNGRYQCAECHHQTSVTARTVLHRTHMPLTQWFLAFYFVSQDKRGISAVALMPNFGGPTAGSRGAEKAKVFAAVSLDERGNPLYTKMRVTQNIKRTSVKNLPKLRLSRAVRFTVTVTGVISRLWRAIPMNANPTIPILVCSTGCIL